MKKNGFTMVEILGVLVILGIIISLVSISYARMDDATTKTYYNTLKQTISLAANDYYSYNTDLFLNINEYKKVTIKKLIDGKYIDKVVSQKGEQCSLDESFVIFSNDEVKVCLKCNGEFDNTETQECKIN